MANETRDISIVQRLAKRLEQDIYRRGLNSGDRYLTANEAANMLGVSRATADRAMSVLAASQMLLRRKSMGTFVGPSAKPTATRMRTVYVVSPASEPEGPFLLTPGTDSLIRGLQRALPYVNVQFSFFPFEKSVSFVRELISEASERGELVGVVAMGCSREVYQFLAESGAPTVVFGSLYLDNAPLPSIDSDHREAARLATRYLIERGHTKMALLIDIDGRPGDHDFLDGINDILAEAGLPSGTMTIRIIRRGIKAADPVIRELLTGEALPTGIITRCRSMADTVVEIARDLALTVPEDLEVTVEYYDETTSGPAGLPFYPHSQASTSVQETALRIGETLKRLGEGKKLEKERVVVPVEFIRYSQTRRLR